MKTLYVTDLDGTLLNSHDFINPYSIETINSLVDQGMLFTYATARSLVSASAVAKGLSTQISVIAYNGAFIFHPATGEILSSEGFGREEREKAVRIMKEQKPCLLVYSFVDGIEKVSWVRSRENEGIRRYLSLRKGDRRLNPLPDEEKLFEGDIFYFTCIGEKQELIPVYEIFSGDERYTCTFQQELYRPEYWELKKAAAGVIGSNDGDGGGKVAERTLSIGGGQTGKTGGTQMRILVVNDDGIEAQGIEILAREAAKFGEVWVVAPDEQCSAMSQCITLRREISVRESSFPVRKSGNFLSEKFLMQDAAKEQSLAGSIKAYRVGGTPADCVKIAVSYLMPQKPDYIFSGINFGYNTGYDVAYSGTVGAAIEGLMKGIPSAAFSVDTSGIYGTVEKYLPGIIEEILKSAPPHGKIWNINFPGCEASACKGILRDRKTAGVHLFIDSYREVRRETDGTVYLVIEGSLHDEIGSDNDLDAVKSGYISIGEVMGMAFSGGERIN